jgi:hypothetical protein
LDGESAFDSIDDAGEFRERAIADQLDDPTPGCRDCRVKHRRTMVLQSDGSPHPIIPHEA